jgi:hypothetical protein
MSKRIVVLATTALCILIGYFCTVFPIANRHAPFSDSPWWNADWKSRVPIYILGGTDALENVQVRLDITELAAPSMRWERQCEDVRFVIFDPREQAYTDIDFWLFDDRITHGAWSSCCASNEYTQYHTPAATYYTNNRPNGIRYVGVHDRTYFVYGDFSRDPVIRFYDHRTRELSDACIVGRTQIPDDAHGNPSLFVDEEGYLYVFYGCHHNPIQMRRSKYPEDISTWRLEVQIPALATYPQPHAINPSELIVTYRQRSPTSNRTAFLSYRTSLDGGKTWSERKDIVNEMYTYPYALTEVGNEQSGKSFHIALSLFDFRTELYTNLLYIYSDDTLQTFKKRDGTDIGIPPYTMDKLDLVFADSSSSSHVNDLILDDENKPFILFNTGPWTVSTTSGEGQWKLAKHNGHEWVTYPIAPCDNLFDRGCLLITADDRLKAYLPMSDDGRDGGEIAEFVSYDEGETWIQEQMVTHDSEYSHNYVVRVANHHPDLQVFWSYGDSSPTGSSENDQASEVYLYGERGIIHSTEDKHTYAYIELPARADDGQLYMYFDNPAAPCASSFQNTMRSCYDKLPSGEKDPDLLVEWLMEEGQGAGIRDNSLYGNDGSGRFDGDEWIGGGTCYERRYDISFSGFVIDLQDDDYILLEQLSGTDYTDQLTVELWFRPSNAGAALLPLVNMWENDIIFHVFMQYGYLFFYTFTDREVGGNFYTQNIASGKWHHLVATYDGAHMELYLDGIKSFRTCLQQGAMRLGGCELALGIFEDYFFDGTMDEFRLYKRAFTEEEVRAHYRKIACCDLTGVWGQEESYIDHMPAAGVRIVSSYPNPFNGNATIAYSVPSKDVVSMDIYDIAGRLIRRLIDRRTMDPGEYEASWDGRNSEGRNVVTGIYFCRLTVGASHDTKKIAILR